MILEFGGAIIKIALEKERFFYLENQDKNSRANSSDFSFTSNRFTA